VPKVNQKLNSYLLPNTNGKAILQNRGSVSGRTSGLKQVNLIDVSLPVMKTARKKSKGS